MAHTFRTAEGEQKYKEHNLANPDEPCALCHNPIISEFTFWKIIPANFPYDLIASAHHMLTPKRHIIEQELTEEEIKELYTIKKDTVFGQYDYLLEPARKSRPHHFHLHLIIAK